MRPFHSSIIILIIMAGLCLADPSIVTQPPANTFVMRPDLAGQHPRLYFTKADTAWIKARAKGPCKWFYDHSKQSFAGYEGVQPDPPGTWKDYLFGFWGQFAMCMYYVVEGDTGYANTARDWALYYARRNDWLTDDLIPMDITSGMALTYDILYDRLSASEKTELRAALKRSIDTIMPAFFIGNYWTEDFDNNHMHNRIHGLAHAAYAIYGDDPAVNVQAAADLATGCYQQVTHWLADDGSTHEGPGYWDYGYHWVVTSAGLIQHVTGVDPCAGKPHFVSDHLYRLYMSTPGFKNTFGIGDASDGPPDNIDTWMVPIGRAQDASSDSAFRRLMHDLPGSSYQLSIYGLFWYDDTLQPMPYSSLPLYRFWPDLEMFSIRGSWSDTATALVFKCGPPGGNRLQQLRGTGYANVAHDHPDQNHFMLYANGRMLADDDGYPTVAKLTRSHNTIVVDSQGQRREGDAWYQPFSYDSCGHLDDIMLSGASAIAAGNATKLYWGVNRFVRHIAFVEGTYLISMDDLVGAGAGQHVYDWRLHKAGTWSGGQPGQFFVADSFNMRLEIKFLEPPAASLQTSFLPAELTAPPCLSAKVTAASTRITAVMTPQKNGLPSLTCGMPAAIGAAAVQVQGTGFNDMFAMRTGASAFTAGDVTSDASNVLVRRGAAPVFASLTRGTYVNAAGKTLTASTIAANLAWRFSPGIFTVEAEPAYNAAGGPDTVAVGGLTPGQSYTVTVNGAAAGQAAGDANGIARVFVNLTGRTTVVLTDNSPVISSMGSRHRTHLTASLPYRGLNRGVTINFYTPDKGDAVAAIYDLSGRRVAKFVEQGIPGGMESVTWRGGAKGVYILKLTQGGDEFRCRFVVR